MTSSTRRQRPTIPTPLLAYVVLDVGHAWPRALNSFTDARVIVASGSLTQFSSGSLQMPARRPRVSVDRSACGERQFRSWRRGLPSTLAPVVAPAQACVILTTNDGLTRVSPNRAEPGPSCRATRCSRRIGFLLRALMPPSRRGVRSKTTVGARWRRPGRLPLLIPDASAAVPVGPCSRRCSAAAFIRSRAALSTDRISRRARHRPAGGRCKRLIGSRTDGCG